MLFSGIGVGYKLGSWSARELRKNLKSADNRIKELESQTFSLSAKLDMADAADRLLKLNIVEYITIDRIMTAEAEGKCYRRTSDPGLLSLERSGIVVADDDGRLRYTINRKVRPFLERYRIGIHAVASSGDNEQRIRFAELVRHGDWTPGSDLEGLASSSPHSDCD